MQAKTVAVKTNGPLKRTLIRTVLITCRKRIGLVVALACLTGLPLAGWADEQSQVDDVSNEIQVHKSANTAATGQAYGTTTLTLVQGESKLVPNMQPRRIAVGNGALLKAKALENGDLLLIGEQIGSTSLQVWHQNGSLQSFRINIENPQNHIDLPDRPIVSLKVRVVEFKEASLDKVGIDWGQSAQGPTFRLMHALGSSGADLITAAGRAPNLGLGFSSDMLLQSTLQFLQTAGVASTLAQPSLSCLSGESASFLAGGEVPFVVTDSNGQAQVMFKSYGIILEIAPKADRFGRIETAIETEVSNIDGSVTVKDVPGFVTRKTKTHMSVQSGQTIVISGLLSRNTRFDQQAVAGLGRLPVLGQFFTATQRQQDETQLVIFVTPTIVIPNNRAAELTDSSHYQPRITGLQTSLNLGMADIDVTIE